MKARPILRGLLLILAMAAIGYAFKRGDLFSHLSASWVDTEVRGHGLRGQLFFLALGALATSMGVPRQIVGFLGGYAFGFVLGTALAALAALLGCMLTFFFSRVAGRELVQGRFSGRIRRIDKFLAVNPLSTTLLIRLLPVGNNMVTNLAAGVSSVAALPFIAGSLVGYLPQMAIFALVGSGIDVGSFSRIAAGALMFVISGMIGMRLVARHRELDDALVGRSDEPEGDAAEAR